MDNKKYSYWSKGMCVFSGVAQSDFMWHLRTNSDIQQIFKEIYNTDDTVTSLDGFSVFIDNTHKSKSWLHIDQNHSNTVYSVQGAINLLQLNHQKIQDLLLCLDLIKHTHQELRIKMIG